LRGFDGMTCSILEWMNLMMKRDPRLNVGPTGQVVGAMSTSMLVPHQMALMIGATWMPCGNEVEMVNEGLGTLEGYNFDLELDLSMVIVVGNILMSGIQL
jgi:hypothetical protein